MLSFDEDVKPEEIVTIQLVSIKSGLRPRLIYTDLMDVLLLTWAF